MNRLAVALFVLLLAVGIVNAGRAGDVAGASDGPPAVPSITTQPASQTVTAGQRVTFTVVAAGTAPLNYQWKKNGTAISGATSSSYTTPATTSSDNGSQFTVVVAYSRDPNPEQEVDAEQEQSDEGCDDDCGTARSVTSSAAILTVSAAAMAPSITTQPASQTVTAGQTARFSVVASGTAPLTYQWRKNGANITTGGTSSSYTTPATTTADTNSTFSVVVSNTAGSMTSSNATLTVNAGALAPTISTQPASQTVTAGQTATFTVVATGTAPLSYRWMKGGSTISGATSSSYTTPATTSADNGSQFTVEVSNTAGHATSSAATLTVSAAAVVPSITTEPANQTVTAGQTATFSVVATGTPPLSYRWMKGGTTILGATSSSYTTPATTSADNGSQFKVVVSNIAGNATSNPATLTVNSTAAMPQFGHVFIVIGENSTYVDTYNSSNMPYLTSLANQYGLATKYWADTHPSIGNYEVFTAGQIFTNDDGQTPSSLPLSSDNIAFEVEQAGKTWKDYVETGNGCGALNSGNYIVRHDPLQYFTNINKADFVCFSQFATDLANHTLPNLSWLSPNGCDDAHDCGIGTFDNWLQTEIGPLLASSYFQPGGDGLLIITWDEDDKSGSPSCTTTTIGLGCGGQVETVVISPLSKLAYKSTAGDPANFNSTYDGANLLRTMADALRLKTSGLGAAATRVPMADFF